MCTAVESMHGVDLGSLKKVFKNIFCTVAEQFSVGSKGFKIAASTIANTFVGADFIPRNPRKLGDHPNFKASEWHMLGFF